MPSPAQHSLPKDLIDALKQNHGASVLVLEPPKGGLRASFRNLLDQEALVELNLALVPDERLKASKECRTWIAGILGPDGGWMVLDPAGRILDKGRRVPSAEALAAGLGRMGVTSPVQRLDAFLKNHPDHQEARAELVMLLRAIAERRTRRVLGVLSENPAPETGTTASRWTGSGPGKVDRSKQLNPEQDILIWGRTAQELERIFQDPAWYVAPLSFTDLAEAHSPTVSLVFRKHIPRVQDLLTRQPSNYAAWDLWVWLHQVTDLRPSIAFIRTLTPVVKEATDWEQEWPPANVVGILLQDARRRGDWKMARDILWTQYEYEARAFETPSSAPGRKPEPEMEAILRNDMEETWKHLFEPLLEALARTGQEYQATTVIQRLAAQPYLTNLPSKLRSLALRMQRKDLAQTWPTLR